MNWIRPYLAVGPIIGNEHGQTKWETLRKNRITAIIDLNDSEIERTNAEFLGFRYHGLPINDPPFDVDELLNAFPVVCDWIDAERNEDGKIYLHCTGGIERSPTCAGAYIMSDELLDFSKAMEQVSAGRPMAWVGSLFIDVFSHALAEWEERRKIR